MGYVLLFHFRWSKRYCRSSKQRRRWKIFFRKLQKYFLENYKKYFNLKTPLKNFKLPYKYGFGHRAYYVISKNKFEKQFFKLEKEKKNYD